MTTLPEMTEHIEDIYADKIWRGAATPESALAEEQEQLVSRIWDEIWNQGELEACDEVFAPDYFGHLPMMDVHGPEQFKQLVGAYRGAYPDVHLTVEDLFLSGNKVAVRWVSRGTHLGAMMGVPPSGNKIEIMGISLFRLENGRVAEEWEGFDTLKMMQQIGALPVVTG
ncbi:MAG: ester cyclase [Chloroflexi bacterium]|nr:ester cyclase [Chloroflexota bacterium]